MSLDSIRGASILIVDDNPTNLGVLFDYLRAFDLKILVAEDGESAFELIEERLPDLILLDIMMPGMNGYEVCSHLKNMEHTKDIPIIFISALTETFDKVKGFEMGGVDYVTKPFQKEEVFARVKAHLTIKYQQKALRKEIQIRKAAEQKFRNLVDYSLQGLVIIRENKAVFVNEAMGELTGYTSEEFLEVAASYPERFFFEEDVHNAKQIYDLSLFQDDEAAQRELRIRRKDGSMRVLECIIKRITYEDSEALQVTAFDVTQRLLAEEALTSNVRKYQLLADNVSDIILTIDEEEQFTYVSPSVEKVLGLHQEDIMMMTLSELLPPESYHKVSSLYKRRKELEKYDGSLDKPIRSEFEMRKKNGKQVWMEAVSNPLRDDDQKITGVLALLRDITERKDAEKALAESEERYRQMFNQHSAVMLLYESSTGIIIDANESASGYYSFALSVLKGMPFHSLIAEDLDAEEGLFTKAGAPIIQKHRLANGEIRDVEIYRSPVSLQGKAMMLAIIHDVTERREIEQLLLLQRDVATDLSIASELIVAVKSILDVLDQLKDIHAAGYYSFNTEKGGAELILSRGLSDEFSEKVRFIDQDSKLLEFLQVDTHTYLDVEKMPDSLSPFASNIGYKGVSLHPISYRTTFMGTLIIASKKYHKFPDNVMNILETITSQLSSVIKRIHIEAALKESESNFRMLFDAMEDIILIIDKDASIIHHNSIAEEILGYSSDELREKKLYELHPPESRSKSKEMFKDVINGSEKRSSLPFIKKSGEILSVDTSISNSFWSNQAVYFGVSRDITEKKLAEEALKRRDAILETVSSIAEQFLRYPDWRYYAHEALKHIAKATVSSRTFIFENSIQKRGEIKANLIFEWTDNTTQSQMLNTDFHNFAYLNLGLGRWERLLSRNEVLFSIGSDVPEEEVEFLKKYEIQSVLLVPIFVGSEWWGAIGFEDHRNAKVWTSSEIEAMKLLADNVSAAIEKQLKDNVLKDQEEQFRHIFEFAPVGMLLATPARGIIKANNTIMDMLGYSIEELNSLGFEGITLKADFSREEVYLDRLRSGEINTYSLEKRIVKNNKDQLWVKVSVSGFKKSDDDSVQWLSIIENIADRKEAEQKNEEYLQNLREYQESLEENAKKLRALNEKLSDSEQKLIELNADKDKFFSIIAHDLKNPFTALLGYTEYLNTDFSELTSDEIQEISVGIHSSARDIYKLLENLLVWSRIQIGTISFSPEIFKLNEVVEDVLRLLKLNASEKDISIETEISQDIVVYADIEMTSAVIRNLLSNAVKFSHPNSVIEIKTSLTNDFVEVSVKDTGVGIRQDMLSKLFKISENFSTPGTAKETGTGLGLILCKEFVEKCGGELKVESKENEGSVFSFTLPLHR